MNILMLSNLDSDDKLEDVWLARAFMEDGHSVVVADSNYDERLDDIFDVFLRRSTWVENANISDIKDNDTFRRIINKNLPRINFDGNYDGRGKEYLVDLYKKGYEVIPSIDNLGDLDKLGNCDKYMLKLKGSYDGIGQMIVNRDELKEKFNENYIIQPFMEFKSEVQFYFIRDKLEYALEFIPSKIPIYPDPINYEYTVEEVNLANKFASLNGDYYGIQRIDFIKLLDGTLLLTEIEDIDPYLDLDCVDVEIRDKFIYDYKSMVYDYLKSREI